MEWILHAGKGARDDEETRYNTRDGWCGSAAPDAGQGGHGRWGSERTRVQPRERTHMYNALGGSCQ